MGEQRQGSEWILSCQRSLRLKCGYSKDLCCHILFTDVVDVIPDLARVGLSRELLS